MNKRIPTTIISGFLGVGKTTAILDLLAQQQARGERWAVLVNEFGEVGIDGAVLQAGNEDQLTVQEIPGGCLCCTVGMHFQVALPRLIRTVRPDRLLIEPTGVGHPSGLLNILRNEWLIQALDLQATICLTDPQQFSEHLLENSPVYYDQLYFADIVVLNKCDQAEPRQIQRLRDFLATLPAKQAIVETTHGRLNPAWLDWPLDHTRLPAQPIHHSHDADPPIDSATILTYLKTPTTTPQRHESQGEGRVACGWIFPAHWRFSEAHLTALFAQLETADVAHAIERAKGFFQLADGDWQLFNRAGGRLEMQPLKSCTDSRVEFIATVGSQPDWNALEAALLKAVHLVS